MRVALEVLFKNIALFFIDRKYRKFIFLAAKLGGSKRYVQKTITVDGMKLSIPDARSFIWQYHEIFTNEYYKINTESEKPLIIDCGSNVGSSVLFFKKEYPKSIIHAFEPDPNIFKYLVKNIESNGLKNIILNNKAVWKKNEELTFNSEGADGGAIDKIGDDSIKIEAIDLKEYLNQLNTIDLLKVDIEGAEYDVFQHIEPTLDKIKNIFVEIHSYPKSTQKLSTILQILESKGFRYYIQNESRRRAPFINNKADREMDMQLNVFAYRSLK